MSATWPESRTSSAWGPHPPGVIQRRTGLDPQICLGSADARRREVYLVVGTGGRRYVIGCDAVGAEAVRQPVREHLGLPEEVRLEIGRRNLHPEVALAHLSLAEVADQRQQRPDLAARELETGAIG